MDYQEAEHHDNLITLSEYNVFCRDVRFGPALKSLLLKKNYNEIRELYRKTVI
jgi:hypothetical protein